MSFLEILDTLLLKPLQLLFEVVYVMADKVIGNPGLSIVVLSLFMNFLVLPLYMRADAIQEEERGIAMKLQKGVEHIKKTFSGDERMMMLQTYYRQNHYKPIYVLRSAVSLFLQIPFFIAAYRFLSGLQLLNGVSFGPIADLGKPDAMLSVAGVSVNILPIIMTVVNLVSCVIFTKGSLLKEKLQLYVMALFFLLFLYRSPSALVFYWTLNNIFSLGKTIFYKLKNPEKVFGILCSAMGIGMAIYGLFIYQYLYFSLIRKMILVGMGILMQLPLVYSFVKIKYEKKDKIGNGRIFWVGGLFLAVLTGGLIPSAVIKASPLEFVDITYAYNPLWFVVSAFCMAIGIFVIWMGVFYFLVKPSLRVYFDKIILIFSGAAIVNYMFFGKNLGLLTSQLQYEKELVFERAEQIWNAIIVITVVFMLCIVFKHSKKLVLELLVVGTLAISCMAIINIGNINNAVSNIKEQNDIGEIPKFKLSRTGKNIIVLMLDRGIGAYIPYIFDEKAELKEQFSGFTYYANVVSFGGHTIYGAPAVFGGYEYTPVEINKRSEKSLIFKHNEALKVMPVLFEQNDYEVVVCNPPFTDYNWAENLSIYDEYPDIQRYHIEGEFADALIKEQRIQGNKRDFFCYSIVKIMPICFQRILYDKGNYNKADEMEQIYSKYVMDGPHKSKGIVLDFVKNYNVLDNFPDITDVVNEPVNVFLMIANEITHSPMLLQEPDYVPALWVDNTEFEKDRERINADGRILKMETMRQTIHYHANMAAMLQLGKWFDYMRENDVYDNTRIILVSDHGFEVNYWDGFQMNEDDMAYYYPILMVKDFNHTGFEVSEEFMTNGDVPTFAVKDIIENPVNPFTGKRINNDEKTAHNQYIYALHEEGVEVHNENTFLSGKWYAVHDDMRNPENWELVAEDAANPLPIDN